MGIDRDKLETINVQVKRIPLEIKEKLHRTPNAL